MGEMLKGENSLFGAILLRRRSKEVRERNRESETRKERKRERESVCESERETKREERVCVLQLFKTWLRLRVSHVVVIRRDGLIFLQHQPVFFVRKQAKNRFVKILKFVSHFLQVKIETYNRLAKLNPVSM